jgi:two-component system response regulator GlrR
MQDHVLLISAEMVSGAFRQLARACDGFRVTTTTWSAFTSAPDAFAADLFVLGGAADPAAIVACFSTRARTTPLFVIFPEHADVAALAPVARLADDFVVWSDTRAPECRERIVRLLGAAGATRHADRLVDGLAFSRLIGRDPAFTAAIAKIPLMARTSGTVLVLGETGTGKELCARAVHHLSPRRQRSFIPVDCGALPDQLFENELFGHVRGAYTDAHRDQVGLLALCDGGTLFLDEVDSLSAAGQAKLLRFLEDRTYRPLGAERFSRADVRVVVATNADLEPLVEQRRFRADLFFRLNVLRIRLPPLRERPDDIPLLAQHFVDRVCADNGIARKRLLPSALDCLRRARWPGNVRELFNVVQQAVVCFDGVDVLPSHLALEPVAPADASSGACRFSQAKAIAMRQFERSYVTALLRKHAGNVTHSALEAGTDRRAFGRLVKKHGIDRSTV